MAKTKTTITQNTDGHSGVTAKGAPGGEALRRRVTDMWECWNDEIMARLRGASIDPDTLILFSQRDYPDASELGPLCISLYKKSVQLADRLENRFRAPGAGTTLARHFAKELSDYGEACKLAGYRAAQAEMFAADQVANWKATASGNIAKSLIGDKRVQQLADHVEGNSLAMMYPTTIARNEILRIKINDKVKLAKSIGVKQLERDLVVAFGILRSKALVPCLAKLNVNVASQEPKALLRGHRKQLQICIATAGISIPTTDKQFEEALDRAIRQARSASPV